VTTTRLTRASSAVSRRLPARDPLDLATGSQARSAVRLDKAHRILDGYDLLGGVVRDFAPELLLKRHDQLDRIEAVGPQIVDKAGVFGHLGLVDAEMLDDDLLHPLGDVTHPLSSSMAGWQVLFGSSRWVSPGAQPLSAAIAAALKVG